MLLRFSVTNFRSISEEQSLVMVPARSGGDEGRGLVLKESWGSDEKEQEALAAALVVGPNGSGKSTIVIAMWSFYSMIRDSSNAGHDSAAKVQPFRLDAERALQPSRFEAEWIDGGVRYRYSFAVKGLDVVSESLFVREGRKERLVYERESESLRVGRGLHDLKVIHRFCRPDSLLLSICLSSAAGAPDIVVAAGSWWSRGVWVVPSDYADPVQRARLPFVAAGVMLSPASGGDGEAMQRLMRAADLGLSRVGATEEEIIADAASIGRLLGAYVQPLNGRLLKRSIHYVHGGATGQEFVFDESVESDGTRRLFALSLAVVVALRMGNLLIVDEIDSRFHPDIVRRIIDLFQNPETNPNNAQLIAAGHAYSLLRPEVLRRDQVWFTEKHSDGHTELFSLAEITGLRKGKDWLKTYEAGQFGAVPLLGDFGAALRGL